MTAEQPRVVIGMDPHKRSVTIEVMTADEIMVGGGRFATDVAGYRTMLAAVASWPQRVWAIEGCNGIGRHIAHRLLADGEEVVDVPPKLSARARVFSTGQGRKTDVTDAHSVALVGTRMAGLRPVVADAQLEVLQLLVDRRRALGEEHTRKISQLHESRRALQRSGRGAGRADTQVQRTTHRPEPAVRGSDDGRAVRTQSAGSPQERHTSSSPANDAQRRNRRSGLCRRRSPRSADRRESSRPTGRLIRPLGSDLGVCPSPTRRG